MSHREYTERARKLLKDSRSIANLLSKDEVRIDDLTVALLRDLSSPGAKIIMDSYDGSDLIRMARDISWVNDIHELEFNSDDFPNLNCSIDYQRVIKEVTDFSRKLHHDVYASVHFPYALANILNDPSSKSEGVERVRRVFEDESRKWNSGLTSLEYLESATTRWLGNQGLPVYGNVPSNVVGKDLFEYENSC